MDELRELGKFERLLRKNFVLKGAMLFIAWEGIQHRDLDLITFTQRKTAFPKDEPVGPTPRFYDDAMRQIQWRPFLNNIVQDSRPESLNDVVESLRLFLLPPLGAPACNRHLDEDWTSGGPWTKK